MLSHIILLNVSIRSKPRPGEVSGIFSPSSLSGWSNRHRRLERLNGDGTFADVIDLRILAGLEAKAPRDAREAGSERGTSNWHP